ncbi:tetratricopeptide repeat protein [Geofilum sp. OHC36d9]|uniref:tetratricopeptide repeat protein n=1 Tax=Geofilum sp. OHC36d9 TaxID=3458413 RepID=UPI0040339DDF
MKRNIILTIALVLAATFQVIADERYQAANELYKTGAYNEAITAYETILGSGVESPEIYYNLGNAYYRNGSLPSAILNYERALLLAPQNNDIRYNLNLAYSQITDKIETVDQFFIAKWFSGIRNAADSDTWAIISIVTFVLFLAGLLFYFFSQSIGLRKLAFFFAIWALISSAITFSYSHTQKQRLIIREYAIVFSPSVTIKSAPQGGGTDLFVLHEGTKVKILQTIDQWHEIMLQDGSVGWMPVSDVEII